MRSVEDIFNDRTCYKYTDQDVEDDLIEEIYNVMKLGPTSGNSSPLRIICIKTPKEKAKLLGCMMEGNIEKTKSAPVTVLFAYDTKFYSKMDRENPASGSLIDYFASSVEVAEDTAFRDSSLQAAYFMIIARGLGLDCGPMSGFNAAAIEKNFLPSTDLKINFLCNLGYKDGPNPYPRLPRLSFAEACRVI